MIHTKLSIQQINNAINSIGNNVVNCSLQCTGVINSPNVGIVPRCIFLDFNTYQSNDGCVIVGINPGPMKIGGSENRHYLQNRNDLSYNTIVSSWRNSPKKHKYYKFLETFVRLIGINGPILWTELVKCEKDRLFKSLPLQTFRVCTNRYLVNELNSIPKSWPVIAVGREAHKALSYIFPDRLILGIPHPTSSRGNFSNLYLNGQFGKALKPTISKKVFSHLKKQKEELWLV